MCSLVHGETETERAEQAAAALFGEEVTTLDERSLLDVFSDAPSTTLEKSRLDSGMTVVDLLVETGLAPSKGQARKTVEQGGVSVNNRRAIDAAMTVGAEELVAGHYLVLRRGKASYHLVRFA